MSTLAVDGLNQYYGGSHILRNLSFEVPAGKVTTLLGRNGVGKTTLLKTLMGLVAAASGSVRFADRDLTAATPYQRARAGIGYVPQGREIFPRLSVGENLEIGLATQPRGARVPERVFEMFPVLRQMMHRRGGDLSGGQQQQLAIGRALAMGPRLLILDEPTEGIQPSIIKDIERAIRSLAATGEMAILLVEQYYDFARSLADQYLVMERGEIVARGEGAEHGRRRGAAVPRGVGESGAATRSRNLRLQVGAIARRSRQRRIDFADLGQHPVGREVVHALEVPERAFAPEAGAALDPEADESRRRERRRVRGARRAVERNERPAERRRDVHQPRIVRHHHLRHRQQVDRRWRGRCGRRG